MRANAFVATAAVSFWLCSSVQADKYRSVEPIASPALIDTSPLRDQPLRVREAFATRLLRVTRELFRWLEHDRRAFADVASFDCR